MAVEVESDVVGTDHDPVTRAVSEIAGELRACGDDGSARWRRGGRLGESLTGSADGENNQTQDREARSNCRSQRGVWLKLERVEPHLVSDRERGPPPASKILRDSAVASIMRLLPMPCQLERHM